MLEEHFVSMRLGVSAAVKSDLQVAAKSQLFQNLFSQTSSQAARQSEMLILKFIVRL